MIVKSSELSKICGIEFAVIPTHCMQVLCGGISVAHSQRVKIIPHPATDHLHLVKHGSLDKFFIIFYFEITVITFPLCVHPAVCSTVLLKETSSISASQSPHSL